MKSFDATFSLRVRMHVSGFAGFERVGSAKKKEVETFVSTSFLCRSVVSAYAASSIILSYIRKGSVLLWNLST